MDHQNELLRLLDQLEEVEEDKKSSAEAFTGTIKQLKNQIKDERRELKNLKSKSTATN